MITFKDLINEVSLKKVEKWRDGKKVRVTQCTDSDGTAAEGYKQEDGKCVKMSPDELKQRTKSAIKAARSRKSQQSQINRKRAKTMDKKAD